MVNELVIKVCDGDEDLLCYFYFVYVWNFLKNKGFFLNQNKDTTTTKLKIIPVEQNISVLKNHIVYWDTWPDYAKEKFWRNSEAALE